MSSGRFCKASPVKRAPPLCWRSTLQEAWGVVQSLRGSDECGAVCSCSFDRSHHADYNHNHSAIPETCQAQSGFDLSSKRPSVDPSFEKRLQSVVTLQNAQASPSRHFKGILG